MKINSIFLLEALQKYTTYKIYTIYYIKMSVVKNVVSVMYINNVD